MEHECEADGRHVPRRQQHESCPCAAGAESSQHVRQPRPNVDAEIVLHVLDEFLGRTKTRLIRYVEIKKRRCKTEQDHGRGK